MPALPTSAMQTVILMDRPLVSNSRILFFISSQESQVALVLQGDVLNLLEIYPL